MNDDQQAERELEQKVIELARMKLSELQYNNFILEANLSKRMQESMEDEAEVLRFVKDIELLTSKNDQLTETISTNQEQSNKTISENQVQSNKTISENQVHINTLKEEIGSLTRENKKHKEIDSAKILEDNKELQRKFDLVVEHRTQLEEEISSLKNPYETVMELDQVVETVVHDDDEQVIETVVLEEQLELNLLDAIKVEEPPPITENWAEGIILEDVDGTNN